MPKKYLASDGETEYEFEAETFRDAMQAARDWLAGTDGDNLLELDESIGEIGKEEEHLLEGSLIEYALIGTELEDWNAITVKKTFSNLPDLPEELAEAGIDWDFQGFAETGLSDFTTWSCGGTSMMTKEVCLNSGVYKHTYTQGSQRNPGDSLESIVWKEADERSEAAVIKHHTDEDGWIPEWLALHLGVSPSTRYSYQEVSELREQLLTNGELYERDLYDDETLEHMLSALWGRRLTDEEREQNLWETLIDGRETP